MTLTDKAYIQKSKLFLLPLIRIKRNPHIIPSGTYLQDETFSLKDYRLIVPYERDESSEFHYYEQDLMNSPAFEQESFYETDRHLVYVFNLSEYESDYDKVVEGKYTELSSKAKTLINIYWGKGKAGKFEPHPKIEAYLSPTIVTYEKYSEELDVPVKTLLKVKELLNAPNIEKETFFGNRISKTKQPGEDSLEISSG